MSNKPIRNQRYRKGPNSTVEQVLEEIELGNLNGIYNTLITNEKMPTYEQAENETILPRKRKPGNNSYIIFGKDRPADLSSGNGGKGLLGSNSIDIVVGLASSHRGQDAEYFDKDTMVGKNVFSDAARIYISQRTDLHRHFGITEGDPSSFSSSKGSGIAVKADHVAVLGRKTVVIKAGLAHGKNLPNGREPDADGREIDQDENRIELIGRQSIPLQPAVRGENLRQYLKLLTDSVQANKSAIIKIQKDIAKLRIALAGHIHVSPVGPTAPSIGLVGSAIRKVPEELQDVGLSYYEKVSDTVKEINALGEDGIQLRDSILSKYVFIS